jgi:hypothetical protein
MRELHAKLMLWGPKPAFALCLHNHDGSAPCEAPGCQLRDNSDANMITRVGFPPGGTACCRCRQFQHIAILVTAHLNTKAAAHTGMQVPGPLTSSCQHHTMVSGTPGITAAQRELTRLGCSFSTMCTAADMEYSVVHTAVMYDCPTSLLLGITSIEYSEAACRVV